MTTNVMNTNQQVARSETPEQIAQRAANALYNIVCFQCSEPFCKHWEAQAATDIAFLLRNERERCAVVALEQRCERGTPWDAACVAIAKAIREEGIRRQ